MKYKYELQKGSKHIHCPSCQKKTFKCYVFTGANIPVDANVYGRCERINSCQYHRYPDGNNDNDKSFVAPVPRPTPPKRKNYSVIPKNVVERSFCEFKNNNFFLWLVKMFGQDVAFKLQEKYNIGTSKSGGTIFWQQDKDGKFRTGKLIYYNLDGKRNREKGHTRYVHKMINPKFELLQVFFGEHLIPECDKPIALCEGEKTAIVMSQLNPEYLWIAAGGSNMINSYRLSRLPRLNIVYPDEGQFLLWEKQTQFFKERTMSYEVENAFKRGEVDKGDDILDLYLKNQTVNGK